MKEKVKERCLGLLLNEHTKNYLQLLQISEKPTLKVKRLRILKIETFKTLNGLNPDFMTELMTDIFCYSCNSTHKKYNLQVHKHNTSSYGNKNLHILGTYMWNSFPEDIKSTTSIYKFKEFMKGWYGCKCYLCFNWPTSCRLHHIFSTPYNISTCAYFIYAHNYLTFWIF